MKIQDISAKVGGYIVWILMLLLLLSLVRNLSRVAGVRSEVQKAQEKVDRMKKENAALEEEVQKAQSDVFVEKQIRDKLGLAREGEAIVILPDEDTLRKLAPAVPQEESTLPDPNWRLWLKLFI